MSVATTTLAKITDGNRVAESYVMREIGATTQIREKDQALSLVRADRMTVEKAERGPMSAMHYLDMLNATYVWGHIDLTSVDGNYIEHIFKVEIPETFTRGDIVRAMHAVQALPEEDVKGRQERAIYAAALIVTYRTRGLSA